MEALIGQSRLPDDDFAVLRAATKYRFADEKEIFEALGYYGDREMPDGSKRPGYLRPRRSLPPQLCSVQDFIEKIVPLVEKQEGTQGIAQGIPLADVIANAVMFPFDVSMQGHLMGVGGYYRRYSDDILLIVPDAAANVSHWMAIVEKCLFAASATLQLSSTKNAILRSNRTGGKLDLHSEIGYKQLPAIEYLGLTFNGDSVALRDSTLSRLNRKIVRRVRKHVRSLARKFPTEPRTLIENRLRLGGIMQDFGRLSYEKRKGSEHKTNFRTYAVCAEKSAGLDLTVVLKQLSTQNAFIRKRASIELDRMFR